MTAGATSEPIGIARGAPSMPEQRTLESIVDPFVSHIGGERISEIVGNINPAKSADYLFRTHNVIAELKSLQAGTFVESIQRKMTDLMSRWQRERKLIVFGTARVDSSKLSPECREEMFSVMAEALQKHVVFAANDQIKSTKKLLNLPDAKGLLWVASDGNEFLQPNVVWYLLHRILKKKKANGDPAYSSIHGLAYFSPRMLGQIPGAAEPALLWFSGYRQSDPQLKVCLDQLSDEWPKYVSWAQGVYIRDTVGKVEDVRFLGVKEKMMQIRLDDQRK
jgi:hypothetical protein